MSVPKGFRKVTFDLQSPDGKDKYRVSCLVCNICQAMVLQNVPQDFAAKHRDWHKKMETSVVTVEEIQTNPEAKYHDALQAMKSYMTEGDANQ